LLEQLIQLDDNSSDNLKVQIRKAIAVAILDGHIALEQAIPSSRKLSQALKVSRQTVTFAYEDLVEEGYLIARERRGYFVNPAILEGRVSGSAVSRGTESQVRWLDRLSCQPSQQKNISKPANWQSYEFPFISGQIDPASFPLAEWRECSKQALSVLAVRDWTGDSMDADDPQLIEQIRTRVLPRRGIWAQPDEILITVGTQHSLYLLSSLLSKPGASIAMEDPGYPDARNIFQSHFDQVIAQPVDDQGLVLDEKLESSDYVYLTPSHQWPTSVTLPLQRRQQLLKMADQSDLVILEDDYDIETNYVGEPSPALKSLDQSGRVIYMSSLSKVLAPGLRIGFMVAPAELIQEARVLRRLMMRHPPMNNQRMTALFLARGHYDALLKRLWRVYKRNWEVMAEAIERNIPSHQQPMVSGGTSYWVKGPDNLDAELLRQAAKAEGILLEAGEIAFAGSCAPRNYFRLGFTVIAEARIEKGVERIGQLIKELCD
jgi:GntR family transcriptional regulator / MocR family aminotransferase